MIDLCTKCGLWRRWKGNTTCEDCTPTLGLDFLERATRWLHGHDTGLSSKAIFHFMTLGVKGGFTPSDPSDLGRCLRLLKRFPEWRERMPEMANCSQRWADLMPYWDLLEKSLFSEVADLETEGRAPETYRMMKAIERGEDPTIKPVQTTKPAVRKKKTTK